jgi:hypothetical protein
VRYSFDRLVGVAAHGEHADYSVATQDGTKDRAR